MIVEGLVDVSGSSVKIDKSTEVEKYRKLADRHFDSGQYQEAYDYYNRIIVDDPDDWEVVFKLGISKGYCTEYMKYSVMDIVATINNALEIVERTISDENNKRQIKKTIAFKTFELTAAIENVGMGDYKNNIDESTAIFINKTEYHCIKVLSFIDYLLNDPAFEKDEEVKEFNMVIALYAVNWCLNFTSNRSYISGWSSDIGDRYGIVSIPDNIYNEILAYYDAKAALIKKEHPDARIPTINRKNSGCYIATSIYGSYDCPEVWTLRRYRDKVLDSTRRGRLFIRTYYKISPTAVKLFGNTKAFKAIFKPYLDRKVRKLKQDGFEDTPYKDKY